MHEERQTVTHEVGLHARPAAMFVGVASKFESTIEVRNRTSSSEWVDAKSILGVLVLGVEKGHEIEIRTEGQDEIQACQALGDLIRSNFGEAPSR